MSHQVDRVLDEVDTALKQLRRSMRGIPVRREGLKAMHDKMAKSMGSLTVALDDARSTIKN
ncbi:hypothetical protein ACPZ19_43615 [Amycolatopsis lurida]